MANNFVKWWKNKFLTGYRQFAADANYGKMSDAEELLIHPENDRDDLRVSCTTPPIDHQRVQQHQPNAPAPSSPPPTSPSHQNMKFEQFSCDVSVEDGVDKRGQQRQEFSFTLYDFDGYGKITKDDIAGLVTTIYEALGSSVKVPHYGSKTIRVKLTVSPDQRKHVSATVLNQESTATALNGEDATVENKSKEERPKRDLNVTIKHRSKGKKKRSCRQHRCCEILAGREMDDSDCVNVSDDVSDVSSADVSSDDERECSDNHYACGKVYKKIYKKRSKRRHAKEPEQAEDAKIDKTQLRSGSLQRQELLEIIQANMNKNNLPVKTTRNQYTSTDNQESTKIVTKNNLKSRKNQRAQLPTLQYLANFMDPAHFYVDLAAFQNATQIPNNNLHYNKLIDAVMCVSNKRVQKKVQSCRKHKPRILDGLNAAQNAPNIQSEKPKRAKISEAEHKTFRRNVKKIPQIVLGNTSAPHYLRHRNRQEDQARAMAQVVRWLEQEFSSNFYTDKKKSKSSSFEKPSNETNSTPGSTIERHEHHHVHEHIHHHYHHYHEAPIVV